MSSEDSLPDTDLMESDRPADIEVAVSSTESEEDVGEEADEDVDHVTLQTENSETEENTQDEDVMGDDDEEEAVGDDTEENKMVDSSDETDTDLRKDLDTQEEKTEVEEKDNEEEEVLDTQDDKIEDPGDAQDEEKDSSEGMHIDESVQSIDAIEASANAEDEKKKNIEDVLKAHPGVFDFSIDKGESDEKMDTEPEQEESEDDGRISPPTTRTTRQRSKAATAEDTKRTQEILASLPCVDRLRPSTGSLLSADKSETGEYASDRESVYSAAQSKTGRKKGKSEKVSKSSMVKKLNTRSAKGRGRRSIAKKKPVKSISLAPTPITSKKIYYKGEYFSVGDIVSVTDESGDIYYGQLRGFMTDQFGHKSGVMSWLLPTTGSPPPNEGFHPATYIIGPDEEIPRSMEVFTFVMHAPSDYFYNRTAPYRTSLVPPRGEDSVKMRRLGPRVIRTVDNKTVYVGIYS